MNIGRGGIGRTVVSSLRASAFLGFLVSVIPRADKCVSVRKQPEQPTVPSFLLGFARGGQTNWLAFSDPSPTANANQPRARLIHAQEWQKMGDWRVRGGLGS